MKKISLFLFVLTIWILTASAKAQITFSLPEAEKQALPGETVSFHATLTNTGTADIYLNSDSISQFSDWSGLTVNDSYFFTDIPWPLPGGEQWSGRLFDVNVSPSTSAKTVFGSFYIFGGADPSASDQLTTPRDFQITVLSSVPEPGSLALLIGLSAAGSLFAVSCLRQRKK